MKDTKKIIEEMLKEVPAKELGKLLISHIVHDLCDMEIKISKGNDGELHVDIETDIPEQMEAEKDSEVLSLLSNALVGYYSDVIAKHSKDEESIERVTKAFTDKHFAMMVDDIMERAREKFKEKE